MKNQEKTWNLLYSKNLIWKKETANLSNIIKNKSVLEIGAGNGKTIISILKQKPKSITAIDFSEEAIKICKNQFSNYNNLSLKKADILSFNSKEKFDIIVCYYVLNNINKKDRKLAVRNILNLLSDKGIVLFQDFAQGDLRQKGREIEENTIKKENGLFCHFFTLEEVKELFNQFKINKLTLATSSPLRNNKLLKRKIISALFRK
jgi:ubiquinone/menaquinone biosynthesis C-methylase UbiE